MSVVHLYKLVEPQGDIYAIPPPPPPPKPPPIPVYGPSDEPEWLPGSSAARGLLVGLGLGLILDIILVGGLYLAFR